MSKERFDELKLIAVTMALRSLFQDRTLLNFVRGQLINEHISSVGSTWHEYLEKMYQVMYRVIWNQEQPVKSDYLILIELLDFSLVMKDKYNSTT